MGPWDDRNYQLTKKDISILPVDDQKLANVPAFFKIQYRKEHPETGKYYPRSLYQNFLGNYGGFLVDGVWYKEGLGLADLEETYGKIPASVQAKTASNEVALENGISGDESAIECNPTNKNNCVAGSNSQNGQAMYYSSNGGQTWTKSQTNPGSSCCDPTVDWSSDGSIVYQGDLSRVGSAIGVRWSRSLNQGQTWEAMKNITTTGSDKEYLHVDRSPSSPYKDNLYMTWHDGNILQFARSTDMGLSFSTPISFSGEPSGIGSDATTDSAGNLYYFYPSTNSNSGIRMLKSTNGGTSFAAGNAQDRYHPWIKVGNDSTVHIGYYDTRHSKLRFWLLNFKFHHVRWNR